MITALPELTRRVNAHIHLPPNFSAFETPAQAVELAAQQGISVLGASNYYDYTVYGEFAALAHAQGIFPLFGMEIITLVPSLVDANIKINDHGNPGKMYLCGKGITQFDPLSEAAQPLLQVIRENDSGRMAAMTEKMAAIFAEAGIETGLDADAIKQRVAARHNCSPATVYLQERHLAQAFQERLFDQVPENKRAGVLERVFGALSKAHSGDAIAIQNEIRSHLMKAGKAAFVTETFVGFDHAVQLILAMGGIPCYPTLADGVLPMTDYEMSVDALIADLKSRGVPCAEFIPLRNTPEILTQYVRAMRAGGLFVTAGTEHNSLELLPMEPACADGTPIPGDIQEIFWEGACVVAAHQHLTLNGEPGFVNAQGKPNSAYQSDDERIKSFAKIGAAIIAKFQSNT